MRGEEHCGDFGALPLDACLSPKGHRRAPGLIDHMDTLREFLHMGGYGFYAWSAYGVTLVVLLSNVLVPLLRARDLRARLARQARLESRP